MSSYRLHFWIEFLFFWHLSLRVPVYLGRKGESVFYDLECHVSFPIARDVPFRTIPFRTIPWRHSTSRVADDTNSHMQVHLYEFMCDQSTNTNSYVIDQSYEKKIKI